MTQDTIRTESGDFIVSPHGVTGARVMLKRGFVEIPVFLSEAQANAIAAALGRAVARVVKHNGKCMP